MDKHLNDGLRHIFSNRRPEMVRINRRAMQLATLFISPPHNETDRSGPEVLKNRDEQVPYFSFGASSMSCLQ